MKVLIIVAHRDDEVLGAGGTIKKHSNNGDEISCLYLGDDELCRESGDMNKQAKESAKVLGIEKLFFENCPDNEFDSIPLIEITQKVEKYIKIIKPDIVYTHWENDLNIDHKLTFEAVMTACRSCNPNCPKEIYSFEVLSSSEWQTKTKFNPNYYVDIEKQFGDKLEALTKYESEMREYPHSRSYKGIEILAQLRGLESGLKYAESFKLIRRVR